MSTYRDFAEGILRGISAPTDASQRRALGAVFVEEGVNHYWNPMNWVLPDHYPAYNDVGVRMYPDFATGVKESANNLLANPRWHDVVAALQAKQSSRFPILAAFEAQYASWGQTVDLQGFSDRQVIDRLAMTMQGTVKR